MKRNLQQLAQWLSEEAVGEAEVTGVAIDTRVVKQGDLFIPFKGERVNGHQFVQQAVDAGASAILWQRSEPNPPPHIPHILVDDTETALQQLARKYRDGHMAKFIGITGSNGKTSTKDIVASLLTPFFKVQKTQGNFNNQLGLPITLLNLDEDTEVAVLEMGMSGFGEIEFLTTLARPHMAIITNIGEAHMQDLGSRAGIAKAKYEIVEGLANDGVLFYDGDEPLLRELVTTKAYAFGHNANNDLCVNTIISSATGSTFTTTGRIEGEFFISVLGEHQVKNTLSAMLVAHQLGLTSEQIKAALQSVVLTDMRMQLVQGANDVQFINDAYNAAPSSVKAAIQFMKKTTIRPKKWLVLADMLELGDEELAFHANLANDIKATDFEYVLLYGPRMQALYTALQNEFTTERLIYRAEHLADLTAIVKQYADADTLVLIKGSRGMQLEQIITACQ
ncbi:UDP-N-acetylmuramoyl-tripeptide--D-alanyl-D-alanine ligase [Lysinibacillus alkalisoli]|uniref:UDP-N-acetylmuramoyl-tripeptide--D-alanyl-D-alanine ligase n=1 Tax=Lysinibacillus alkalisoli TaxID=1911548 RepID=A0A917LHT7_9BACI|nr:UDP-N-acetylmuramoyl-tripeptide--D-alanyl-D-alanine ligase [Lysinibacillus alkalisoli]GGG24988.1 UDP-N-acetylmuramoyl-tripeptide--D-alanyl-D-alanine ligase [Lysinibacillus alkalisoli]